MSAGEILVVDDELGIRELLSEILQDEGYLVTAVENAKAAREYRNRQRPALVLLGIRSAPARRCYARLGSRWSPHCAPARLTHRSD